MTFSATLKRYSTDTQEKAIEQAAIMEIDGGLSRHIAEIQALRICGIENPGPLKDVITIGATLTACRNDNGIYKPYRPGEDFQARRGFWEDIEAIQNLKNGNGDPEGKGKGECFELFRFEPGACGLCVIDLDRGHSNGIDGIKNFISLLPLSNLPDYLHDIVKGSHPSYVRTPSGGLHLYFKHFGAEHFKHMEIVPGVEFFHFGNMINAPGSIKNGKPYRLYGTIQSAPILPGFLRRIVKKKTSKNEHRPFFTYNKKGNRPALNRIMEWASDSKKITGRNYLCFEFALRAARYGYEDIDTQSFLQNHPVTSGHKQIRDAVRSAYRRQGGR